MKVLYDYDYIFVPHLSSNDQRRAISIVEISGGWRWPSRSPTGTPWKRVETSREMTRLKRTIWSPVEKITEIRNQMKSYHFLIFPPRKIAVRWWNSIPSFLHVLTVLGKVPSPHLWKNTCRKNVSEIPEISSPLKIGRNPQGKDRLPTIIFQGFWLLVWRNYNV